jgi:hypothetical protein
LSNSPRRAALVLPVVLLIAAAGGVTAFEWRSRGIGGGGALYSPSISPHEAGLVFLATDMGAVFRSADFGSSWATLPFLELVGGVESEVRFTSDPSVLYAIHLADDLRAPVKSVDWGVTWEPLASDPTWGEAYTLWADPASTERLLVAAYSELYCSTDGGSSFHQVHSAPDEHVAGVLWDGANVFVGARDGLLVSTDGGGSFGLAAVGGIPADEAMVSMAGAREGATVRLYAVTLGSGDVWPLITGGEHWSYRSVYRLDVGSGGWVQVTGGITGGAHPFFVATSLDEADVAWLAGGDGDTSAPIVYRTTDGGASWAPVLLTAGNANVATGWSGDGGDTDWWYGEYALGFAVAPRDPARAIVSDLGFAHVTTDGGVSWRQAYDRPEDSNPPGQPTPQGRAYTGNGLEDTSAWALHWASPQTLVASFTDIRGTRSTDGGASWSAGGTAGLPHNTTYRVVEHPTTHALYAATSTVHDLFQSTYLQDSRIDGGDGGVVISTDQGARWEPLHDFGHPVVWLAFDPGDSDTMVASVVHSGEGGLYITHDLHLGASASWTRLAVPTRTHGHPFTVTVLADGGLVASYSGHRDPSGAFTESSGVFLSTDGGSTWLDRSDPGMRRWTKDLVVDPHDPAQDTWYAAVFSHWGAPPNEVGGLYRTLDRGLTWARVSDLYRVESVAVDPDDPDLAWLTTETEGLWRTSNLRDPQPVFVRDPDYPFGHPVRVFSNPFDHDEVWTTSFGNGLRVHARRLFVDGFESGSTAAWTLTVP